MLTAEQKIAGLETAIEKLHEADALMQEALGAGDLCYELHTSLENIADELQAEIDTLRALRMQGVIA
jgi:hypothetical protein